MCREVTNPASDDIHALIQLLHIGKSAAFPNKFWGLLPHVYIYGSVSQERGKWPFRVRFLKKYSTRAAKPDKLDLILQLF